MTYEIPKHILDILMPLAKTQHKSPIKLIEEAIYTQYEDNVCQQPQASVRKQKEDHI